MKRKLWCIVIVLALMLVAPLAHTSVVHTAQVTIGSGVTQVSTADIYAHTITFQNNATHSMRIGDSNTTSSRGALLGVGPPGGSMTVTISPPGNLNLSQWYVAGTQNDVLDVIYVD